MFQDNARIDANVFQLCRDNNVNKIIYTSSVSVYPTDKQVFEEKDFDYTNPEGGYGWAKTLAEYQLALMEDCRTAIVRLFNVYGGGDAIDETASVISRFMRRAIEEKDLIVYDGMQTRNYLYISDCIEALMRMEKVAGYPPRIINIASNEIISINELAKKIVALSGNKVKIKHDFTKLVGPFSRIAKIDAAKVVLKWEPTIGLDEGLKKTYKWFADKL